MLGLLRILFALTTLTLAWGAIVLLPLWACAQFSLVWFGGDSIITHTLSVWLYYCWVYGISAGLVVAWLHLILMSLSPVGVQVRELFRGYQVELIEEGHPVYELLRIAAEQLNWPMPMLYATNGAALNACAISKGGAGAVVVNAGLVSHLTPNEMLFVMGHEVSHLKRGDAFSGTIMLACGRSAMAARRLRELLSRMIDRTNRSLRGFGLPITAPLLLLILVTVMFDRIYRTLALAADRIIGRRMEYRADREGALVAGVTDAESALHKLRGGLEPSFGLMATHPTTTRRIRKLRATKP